ncbi:hypothetical protein AXW85_33460 [Pseudomonas aeruginosa]|nr:hypothetical protein AXW85_33460 [Pseudomonas aeruginosa]
MRSSFAAMPIENSKHCPQHLPPVLRYIGSVPSILGDDFRMRRDRIAECETKIKIVVFAPAQLFVEATQRKKNVTAV